MPGMAKKAVLLYLYVYVRMVARQSHLMPSSRQDIASDQFYLGYSGGEKKKIMRQNPTEYVHLYIYYCAEAARTNEHT